MLASLSRMGDSVSLGVPNRTVSLPVGNSTVQLGAGALMAPPQSVSCGGPPVCCPCESWAMQPGMTKPLWINWASNWIGVPGSDYGFNLDADSVISASLTDPRRSPGSVPADPSVISVGRGLPGTENAPDNADVRSAITVDGTWTVVMVTLSPNAVLGHQFQLNMSLSVRDCRGRIATIGGCVIVTVTECL